MKKTHLFYMLLIGAAGLTGCGDDTPETIVRKNPVVEFDIQVVDEVKFGEEVTVSGTASSPNAVRDISFFLVKRAGDSYERLWFSPMQYGAVPVEKQVRFEANVRIDDPDAEAIAVEASDPYGQKTVCYLPIGRIDGSPSGSAYVLKGLEMTAEYEYGDACPYVFSLTGVPVDGTLRQVVSLDEIKRTGARNLDFAFINVWRNTTNHTAGVLGNWGYGFCEFRQLARGPVGRQCDFIRLSGNTSIPAGTDTCCVVSVSAALAEAGHFDEVFENAGDNYATSNFLNSLANLFTANAIGNQYVVNLKSNASGVNTTACKENATEGSYIAFRKTRNGTEYTYGLLRIAELPDVSDAVDDTGLKYKPEPYADGIVDNAHLPRKWYDGPEAEAVGIARLYGRTVRVDVIAQRR